jgi:RNA polymerase I-specific transcription initiation factor RRN7
MSPGQSYAIYRSRDVTGSLPEELEMVCGRAARWVGVKDIYFCSVVERFERRLVKWWDGKRTCKERARKGREGT